MSPLSLHAWRQSKHQTPYSGDALHVHAALPCPSVVLACDHPCVSHALQKYSDILTTSNMSLTDFVDLIDAGALSVEFYYFLP